MPRFDAHRSIWPVLLAVFALLVTGAPAQAAFPGSNGKIAFQSDLGSNDNEIYTMNADGSGVARLTNNTFVDDSSPVWSPDGTKIAFWSSRSSFGEYEIYTMNADGSGVARLTNNSATDAYPAWSPDSTKIVFYRDVGDWEIYTMNADGSNQTNVTNNPAFDLYPAWSPDGTKIAFASDRSGNSEIYVMNPDGSGVTNLTNSSGGDSSPDWSSDGTKIAFASGPGPSASVEIYTMNTDGSEVTRLTTNSVFDFGPAWSPDGTKILFTSHLGDNSEIYSMNTDGSDVTNLTNNPSHDGVPDWQPIHYTGYARPKAASPINTALAIAYKNCTTPNREHGPPLAYPSCAPPGQESDWLTTGTTDSNGQATTFTGSARFRTVVGDPATPADEADVATVLNIADVRNKADLTDYTGEVEAITILRITDRFNTVAPGGGGDPATMVDIPFPVRASCAVTADPGVGSTCTVSTSVEVVLPGAVKERQRAIWEVGAIEVYDGGADGITATNPNTLFARQGVFVP